MSFANVHPFFVHAPLVLIPLAAVMSALGRRIKQPGFDLAVLLITVGAALGALAAMVSGLTAPATFAQSAAMAETLQKHQINGVILGAVSSLIALLAIAEWRGLGKNWLWWVRMALLVWVSVGAVFSGHNGARLVYQYGAAVSTTR
jgi:uncharacterized membrane protein